MPNILLERVYQKPLSISQNSYLIDRLWPRGIAKAKLADVIWLKEIAPSNELRKWYHEHLDQWNSFYQQYQHELENNQAVAILSQQLTGNQVITLLYGSKDPQHNHAIVLRDFLYNKLKHNNSAS
ncbi:uncharacterized protein YeaO (DUF488 family) [Orbus hercynius]|uniref:Uncharacterized protein YeaO (DUF488 family) n=1 Tax=Orbus hercynius TaxID=593135 RepID=A0A495RI00_9GAMM|nr:DUF488 family protein [Orbus hercynius]RKS86894.1 uncharacterized protein YeaO (DUF488 family) [Orbus hercynius]